MGVSSQSFDFDTLLCQLNSLLSKFPSSLNPFEGDLLRNKKYPDRMLFSPMSLRQKNPYREDRHVIFRRDVAFVFIQLLLKCQVLQRKRDWCPRRPNWLARDALRARGKRHCPLAFR